MNIGGIIVNEDKVGLYFLGVFLLVIVVGIVGMTWAELDKNNKCFELVNNPTLDPQKHADVIERFCR